ncbi:MAG: DUF3299 domain-containing protein [Planctomycetota bacterium]
MTSRERLLPFIALTVLVGCGSNTDSVPYAELPAVQMEGIPAIASEEHGQKTGGASVANGSVVTASRDASQDLTETVSPTGLPTKNSATQQTETASQMTVAESSGAASTGAKATEASTGDAGGTRVPASELKTVVSSQTGLAGPADTPQIENTAGEIREIKLLIPEKKFQKERGTTALRVSYDDIDLLKVMNMEPVPANAADHFPGWLQELNGKSVRIRGFMYPTFEATGLTEFTMARDNGICCFVRKPKIYDIIGVTLAEGVTTDYIEGRPFDVEGTFHIEPESDDFGLYRLYRISDARVVR